LNRVFRTQLTSDNVDEAIEAVLTHFKAWNVPLVWMTESAMQPPALGTHLEAYGFTYTEGLPGMAADVRALNEDVPTPPGLTIAGVGDREMLKKWLHPYAIGFRLPAFRNRCFEIEAGLGLRHDLPRRHYVGVLKGEPVASSTLFLGAGVAGIYNVATVPEARRQGIGAAMTLATLREARALDYRIGILHASSMGLNVYRWLRFKEYCRLSAYVWTSETTRSEETDNGT
jgi:GNAT superfamily N-acetyltransferase